MGQNEDNSEESLVKSKAKSSFWDINLFGWKPNPLLVIGLGLLITYGLSGGVIKIFGPILLIGGIVGFFKNHKGKHKQ